VLVGLDLVEDAAQALALLVGEALRDAVRRAVGDEDDEPAREGHLLGEASALAPMGFLRDLAQNALASLEDLLDASRSGPASTSSASNCTSPR